MEKQREMQFSRKHLMIFTFWIFLFITFTGSTFGFSYDYSSSCARPYRSGKSHNPVAVPCDLNKQSYCNLPGASYPWHAVRRFVHENQGLMRRMYGDQRHISVLKAEIENNDLDDGEHHRDNRDETYGRNIKDGDAYNTKNTYSKKPTDRSSDSYGIPHFRPVQTTPSTHKQKINKEKESENLTTKNEQTVNNKESTTSNKHNKENIKIISYKTTFLEDDTLMSDQQNQNLETNKIETEIVRIDAALKQNNNMEPNEVYPTFTANLKNISIGSTQSSMVESTATTAKRTSVTESTTTELVLEETTVSPEVPAETTTEENGGWKPVSLEKLSTLSPSTLFSESVKNEKYVSKDRVDHNTAETVNVEQAKPNTASTAATTASNQNNMEGVLFQDAEQEEAKPVMKLRGVNACPVKEEVVAPFWANNTRGEILALLNLYPFEQYVHWEKCVHEHKQMFCKDGCRCEQQYRLHRLLAYDPNNECRGIFSDWFRFPSCCVCKCYDLPLEFRVTSRSPRSVEPEIDEAVKQQMYQHATSDWYTINLEG